MTKRRTSLSEAADREAREQALMDAAAGVPEQEAPTPAPMPERVSPMPDGRSLRATGRTHQFSTRIKLETHDKMKWLALHERITLGELLERMTDLYEQQHAKS